MYVRKEYTIVSYRYFPRRKFISFWAMEFGKPPEMFYIYENADLVDGLLLLMGQKGCAR